MRSGRGTPTVHTLPHAGAGPRFIDITRPIRPGMAVWPGDPQVEFSAVAALDHGHGVNVTQLSLGSHTGTHVDAPSHVRESGAAVDAIPLDALIGPCRVVAFPGRRAVTAQDLAAAALPPGATRLLIKADPGPAGAGPVALTVEAARWMVGNGIRLAGVEGLSVEDPGPDGSLPVHHALLSAGVVIAEGLDLSGVSPGDYWLLCLPLRLAGCDGAPVRAVLCKIQDEHTPARTERRAAPAAGHRE